MLISTNRHIVEYHEQTFKMNMLAYIHMFNFMARISNIELFN